jgi:hypothetical protein
MSMKHRLGAIVAGPAALDTAPALAPRQEERVMERIAFRSTSTQALMAELHREDLLREAAGHRVEREPSIAEKLRLLAWDVTRGLGRVRGVGRRAMAADSSPAPSNASRTTWIPRSIPPSGEGSYPNISRGRAIPCTN